MTPQSTFVRTLLGCALLCPAATAQFNNVWVEFASDSSRIKDANGASAGYILSDPQEKDFAAGDLNQDGWTDLVIVRKQPATTTGAFPNYLLMNEGGQLVDRSAQFASDTDVPGDLGFVTPTNDRDVVITDVNLDGWLDVVTCTAMSDGQPKHISHPRIYINKGSINGEWQGLRFENFRFPTFPITPRFCGVAAGDVTGDGAPDLYFADYGSLEDRLLINDGNGNFTDSGTSRMTSTMLDSGFGSACDIVDMNGDGALDIMRAMSGSCSIAYNDPSNIGFFPAIMYQAQIGAGATYHADVGDLNRDDKPDVITSDDGQDTYRYNLGNDGLGRVAWGPLKTYTFLTGGDDGFAGSDHVIDLDGDGWNDVLYADFDVDIPGCGRRAHIYHNLGGTIGAQVTLREEAEAAGFGWRGVKGMQAGDLIGTYDMGFLDLDHDGDMDMVFGRCNGTFVWMNQGATNIPTIVYPYGDTNPNSTGFKATAHANGTPSSSVNNFVLQASGMPPMKTCLFLYGTQRLFASLPFGDGQRWTGGAIQRLPAFQTDANGDAAFACDFNSAPMNLIPIGQERDAQIWFRDPIAGPGHSNVSKPLAFWRVD